jgi:hypothetical protein
MPDENVFLAAVWSQIIIFKNSHILLTYLIILSTVLQSVLAYIFRQLNDTATSQLPLHTTPTMTSPS